MATHKAHIKRIMGIMTDYGFSVVKMRSKKHIVIHAKHETGNTAVFTTGVTPSDHRSIRNFEALVRRSAIAA